MCTYVFICSCICYSYFCVCICFISQTLYFSLPFFGDTHPIPRLVFSSQHHTGSLAELYKRAAGAGECPSVLLLHSGEFVFGAYLSHRIRDNSLGCGSPSCFLFSLTLDTKIPFHGKNGRGSGGVPYAFTASESQLEFGNRDLCLLASGATLSSGTSELEGCFGLGLDRGSAEAKCFLAGQPQFAIDIMELWTVK